MNPDKFAKIADSLRQYRRAELGAFENDMDGNPVELLYVDPLQNDAVLNTVLRNNTTFIIGRKGTGKSTVFARAQGEIRKRSDCISVYIDVKSLHELLSTLEVPIQSTQGASISESILRIHLLRKSFLGAVIADLIKEIKDVYESRTLFSRWVGKARTYLEAIASLEALGSDVRVAKLTSEEIPILTTISAKSKHGHRQTESNRSKGEMALSTKLETKASMGQEAFDESIEDNESYQEYADAMLRSFPFQELITQIRGLLQGVNMSRLFIFFDDFSELALVDQKLFVDVILAPLNNASDETVKLKVAGYPGRIYYGKIDPSKIDTIGLDFYQLYKAPDIQTSEASAVDYLQRLLLTRFNVFGEDISEYFEPYTPMSEYYRILFETTLNVPRLIGSMLQYCYLDRISKNMPINISAIRLAAQKYYDGVISPYFDRMNRFAIEPFDRKMDRHNQQQLLKVLVTQAKIVRSGIKGKSLGGQYFDGMENPPVSHFAISRSMEKLLSPLELNFLITKYHEMRDKSAKDVSIYALSYGLCESEKLPWGYPRARRDDRSYFVQRCFNFNSTIEQFLSKNQTIKCDTCGSCFGMDKRDSLEFYKWVCPECHTGKCNVVSLGDDFRNEVEVLNKDTMLLPVELQILQTLNEEGLPMKAGEIAGFVDATHQKVGHSTSKLRDQGLVRKSRIEGTMRSKITSKARRRYFGDSDVIDDPPSEA